MKDRVKKGLELFVFSLKSVALHLVAVGAFLPRWSRSLWIRESGLQNQNFLIWLQSEDQCLEL